MIKLISYKAKIALLFFVLLIGFYYIFFNKVTDVKSGVDLVITVKTSLKNHNYRVKEILATWYQLAPEKIYFVTDAYDPILSKKINQHLVNTSCGNEHSSIPLRCKFNAELHVMLRKNATWSCHFDDDNYVNIPALENILNEFDPTIPLYLGRTATAKPSRIQGKTFWYGAGGAGICISNAALQIISKSIQKNYILTDPGAKTTDGDDIGFGYMMHMHNISITEILTFLMQYDRINKVPLKAFKDIPVFAYRIYNNNFVDLPFFFPAHLDPFKFRTLHCFIFPEKCKNIANRLGISIHMSPNIKTYGLFTVKV